MSQLEATESSAESRSKHNLKLPGKFIAKTQMIAYLHGISHNLTGTDGLIRKSPPPASFRALFHLTRNLLINSSAAQGLAEIVHWICRSSKLHFACETEPFTLTTLSYYTNSLTLDTVETVQIILMHIWARMAGFCSFVN